MRDKESPLKGEFPLIAFPADPEDGRSEAEKAEIVSASHMHPTNPSVSNQGCDAGPKAGLAAQSDPDPVALPALSHHHDPLGLVHGRHGLRH